MSLHEAITARIQREIDLLGSAVPISPTTLAIRVQKFFLKKKKLEPHLQYTSLEHLKQMTRRVLAGRYSPEGEENPTHQGDMFSGHLQERYPTPRKTDEDDPLYKPLEMLTQYEADWNVKQLRKSANARVRHADALEAWNDERKAQRSA